MSGCYLDIGAIIKGNTWVSMWQMLQSFLGDGEHMSEEFLHIYGQENNHDPVFIIGSRQDLSNLMTAINKALYFPTKSEHYVSDGEGYSVFIIALDKPELNGEQIHLPYTDSYGTIELQNKGKHSPYQVWQSMRKYFGLKP
jgi:hypothetical protein